MAEPEYAALPMFLAPQPIAAGGITLSSSEVNITPTALTTPVEAAILISAAGTETVTLSNLVCSEAEVTAAFSSDTVDPATPCTLTITLAPTELLEKTFTVTFDTSVATMPTVTVLVLQNLATNVIYASADVDGSIAAIGPVEVPLGSTQVFAVTADAGFVLDELLVDDVPAVLTNGTYTFTNVTEAHTISATFVAEP